MSTENRGFASMDREQQRAIASKGGKTISRSKEYMSEIGRKGGKKSGEVRSAAKKAKSNPLPSEE